ncbi:hypothetical protein BGZ63DRAFT_424704 [Mariannaea sp. PMI_226]|nr:hypothetical protein BGZ63DRAFT_424704 [Mariannaea sp. PMI_226]
MSIYNGKHVQLHTVNSQDTSVLDGDDFNTQDDLLLFTHNEFFHFDWGQSLDSSTRLMMADVVNATGHNCVTSSKAPYTQMTQGDINNLKFMTGKPFIFLSAVIIALSGVYYA